MRVHIIVSRILDDNNNLKIGGVETYTDKLAELLVNSHYDVCVYEYGKHYLETRFHSYCIKRIIGTSSKAIIKYIDLHEHDYKNDIVIFSTDYLICKNMFSHTISIQHGISWDVTYKIDKPVVYNYYWICKGMIRSFRKLARFRYCRNMVCVDYNFVNWYRTQVKYIKENIFVIPNFADCPPKKPEKKNEKISIVFARRFVTYRGTRLFAETIMSVLEKYPEISVTVAGNGPDEDWMKRKLKDYNQVTFTSFKANESISFHSNYDIAVVPTLGSEGTSLSLLEAMASGCAVIATNIGGMTNIILNGYNGLLTNPDKEMLEKAICSLIIDSNKRDYLSERAYETVRDAFSYNRWCNEWLNVLSSIC